MSESIIVHPRRTKLCILQDRLRNGGTERNSIWLANALAGEGLDTHLLLFVHPSGSAEPPVPQWSALRSHRCRFIPDCHAPGLIQTLRKIQADAVICMGRNANCHGARVKKQLPDVRLFTTYRTNRRLPRLYRKSIGVSDGCITNSHWAREQLVERLRLLPGKHIHVIHNPLTRKDLLALKNDGDAKIASRKQLGLSQDALVCINCSHYVAGKNQAAMLNWLHAARKKRPGLVLLLLGDGPTRKRCMTLVKRLQITPNVRFCGQVDSIEPYLQASDLYLSTSLREGSPNALVEAQAAGLPVVAYNTAGCAETFIDKQSGILTPMNDLDAFTEAIEDLLSQPAKRALFSSHAREFAHKQFDPAGIRQKYLNLLCQNSPENRMALT
jgi:glycosyltransferase involved in cell wall biosynthesis